MNRPEIHFTSPALSFDKIEANWLVIPIWEDSDPSDATLKQLDSTLGGIISQLRDQGDLTGKHLEHLTLYEPKNILAQRILLLGLGKRERASFGRIHDAASSATHELTTKQLIRIAFLLPSSIKEISVRDSARAMATGAAYGCFGPSIRKSEPSRFVPAEIAIMANEEMDQSSIETSLKRSSIEAHAIALARELVNTPPAELYPENYAQFASTIASELCISCTIWDEKQLQTEKMGAIIGVAQGSDRPPRFVKLEYRNGKGKPTLALVGKGVTFDSGGMSMKTSEQMVDMKCDMAGSATVLCALKAIVELQVPINLLVLMPLVENMVNGRATKLGDVLVARNGKTIEVLNTDAEGRLILADALSYAAEQKVEHIVDLATLTGSCMVALGTEIAGLMTNHDTWGEKVRSAILRAGERAWPLPMDEDFDEMLKSKVADLKNIPPNKYGGAIAGGKFLQQFVDDIPWVHLDIAGPAFTDSDSSIRDSGATGAYVRSLIELAISYE